MKDNFRLWGILPLYYPLTHRTLKALYFSDDENVFTMRERRICSRDAYHRTKFSHLPDLYFT